MAQEVKEIDIEKLILWTENPRDPIDSNANNQDIVDQALENNDSKWELEKLAKEMGDYYDFSELPTVVIQNGKPVVYDGNRRMVLGKIKYDLVKAEGSENIEIPAFPQEIPCNVCSEDIAVQNVYRKHADSGSWDPLERDIFVHKFLDKDKSNFLILDDETGVISANPSLNLGYIRKEVFKKSNLDKLGLKIEDGKLYSFYNKEDTFTILSDLVRKLNNKEITTRKNRGKVIEVLEPSTQTIIDQNRNDSSSLFTKKFTKELKSKKHKKERSKRQSRRTKTKKNQLFGGKLYLRIGKVSNLYRDIRDLNNFYLKNKNDLSELFPSLLRMALRLLCETAADDRGLGIADYVENNFKKAKSKLDENLKTTLANQNVHKGSITQLLQTGAHSYDTSSNVKQTIAVSIIVGKILTITHGQDS